MLFSQRKLQENKDNSFSTFFVKTNKNIDSKIQHKVGHRCHVCTMLKVSGHFTRVLKFGPETIYLVLNMMKDSFFCLRFHREILNIFAELLCCPGPVSGHNNNNVIIHKFDRQATYKLLLHLQSHSGIRFQKFKSTWEPSIVKQNITYNNWGMVGKTTRAADLGWKCGEKKWTI